MLSRLARSPVLIVVGAGAVLTLGSASAVLAQVGPAPGVSPAAPSDSPTPSTPQLAVSLARTSTTPIHSGTDVGMIATVSASGGTFDDVLLAVATDNKDTVITAKCVTVSDADRRCKLGTLNDTDSAKVELHVIPQGIPFGTVTVSAEATSGGVTGDAKPFPLKVTESSSPSPNSGGGGGGGGGGKTGGGKTSGGTTGGAKTSGGGGGGGGGGTTGGTTGGNVPAPMATLSPPSATGVTSPSVAPSPGAVLPSIGTQSPPVAGNSPLLNAGNSQSMRGKAEGPSELTFNKLASTQAAWLAALLVAFSLLLTQVRLGRAANRVNRVVGVHRRLRRRARRPRSH